MSGVLVPPPLRLVSPLGCARSWIGRNPERGIPDMERLAMTKKKGSPLVKGNSSSLEQVAELIAKGEDPDTFVPVWTEYISGLAATGIAVDIDRVVSLVGMQALRSALELLIKESIESTNDDKRYFLQRLAELNKIAEALAEQMKAYQAAGENLAEKTFRPDEMLWVLKILRHTALAVTGSKKVPLKSA